MGRELAKRGIAIKFSSSSEAVAFLRNEGQTCQEVPLLDVGWDRTGGFSGVPETLARLPAMSIAFLEQLAEEVKSLRSFAPHLVLSDSRLSAVLASALTGVDCITILNQLRILLPPSRRSHAASLAEEIGAEILGRLWALGKEILLPDLPPPYTISEANLRGIRATQSKVRYVGFAVPRSPSPDRSSSDWASVEKGFTGRPLVFASVSSPGETKRRLLQQVCTAAEKLHTRFDFVISAGIPGGSILPQRMNWGTCYEWCPVKDQLFERADVVLARGGHSSIAQAILNSKPLLCIPIPQHSEQIANSMKVAKLGIGLMLDQEEADPARLNECLDHLVSDASFGNKLKSIGDVARSYDGVREIVKASLEMINLA